MLCGEVDGYSAEETAFEVGERLDVHDFESDGRCGPSASPLAGDEYGCHGHAVVSESVYVLFEEAEFVGAGFVFDAHDGEWFAVA